MMWWNKISNRYFDTCKNKLLVNTLPKLISALIITLVYYLNIVCFFFKCINIIYIISLTF